MNYSVKIVCRDRGKNREYSCDDRGEASAMMATIHQYDSDQIERVALLNNETQTVEWILLFESGKVSEDFHNGDIVCIRPEYYDDEREKDYLFQISNIHEDIGSCLIKCINSGMAIAPCQQVGLEMIRKADLTEFFLQ